jgi:hypothetical protein
MQPTIEAVLTFGNGRLQILDVSHNFPAAEFVAYAALHGVQVEFVQHAPCG